MNAVRTTHVGSLPRPTSLLPYIRGDKPAPADFEAQLAEATDAMLKRETEVGIDFVNDGELGRRDYVTAARLRMAGFDKMSVAVGAGDLEEMTEYSDKFEGRKGLLTLTKKTKIENPACGGPISYTEAGLQNLQQEIDRVLASAKRRCLPTERVFFSSPSPGTVANFFPDEYYKVHADYVGALAKAMKTEYEAVYKAGLMLQIDCPDLAMGRHTMFKSLSTEEFVKMAEINVSVLNEALADIPDDRMRLHVCWGNYPGPHHHDVPLKDIIHTVMKAKPKYLSIEACNPGHAHEWEVFETVKLPPGKVLMPGVIDTTTSHIEHPQLVKQRLMNYIKLVGPGNVMACTDCGFSTAAGAVNVPEQIVYQKLRSMVEGAKLATEASKDLDYCPEVPPQSAAQTG